MSTEEFQEMSYEQFSTIDIEITPEIQKEIDRVIQNAVWSPVTFKESYVERTPDKSGRVHLLPEDVNDMSKERITSGHTVHLPYGITAIYLHENQPGTVDSPEVVCRHLQVVGNAEQGYFPSPEQLAKILPCFGFINTPSGVILWVSDSEHNLIVNLMEPIDGDLDKMRPL